MTPRAEPNPIELFLGPDANTGGPFAILGLKHTGLDEPTIKRAGKRCLEQIQRHPRARTPAADEARLAVHTAVSQLLDPTLRGELAKHWPEGQVSRPVAWNNAAANTMSESLVRQARVLIGASGGWNTRARKRLSHFARTNRLSAIELIASINRAVPAPLTRPGATPSPYTRTTFMPPKGSTQFAIMLVGYALVAGVLIGAFVLRATNRQGTALQEASQPTLLDRDPVPAADPGTQDAPSNRTHISALTHELQRAEQDPDPDPAMVLGLLSELSDRWTEYAPDQLRQASETAIRVARVVQGKDAFAQGMEQLARQTFGDALSRALETRAPTPLGDPLRQAFSERVPRLEESREQWERWVSELNAFAQIDPEHAAETLRSSVYASMTAPVRSQGAWADISRLVAPSMNWRRGSGDRVWFLSLLDDPLVRSDRLSVFSEAMLTHASVPEMTREMAIPPDASAPERSRVLAMLRSRWASTQIGDTDIRARILERARLLADITPEALPQSQAFTRIVEIASVNAAARSWTLGDPVSAALALELEPPVPDTQASGPSVPDRRTSDVELSEAIRNTSEPEALIGLLDRAARNRVIGPWTAHSLLTVALRSPSSDARERAAMILRESIEQPSVLAALQSLLTEERQPTRTIALIEELLHIDDPNGIPFRSERTLDVELRSKLLDAIALSRSPLHAALSDGLAAAYSPDEDQPDGAHPERAVFMARASVMNHPDIDRDSIEAQRVTALASVTTSRASGGIQQTLAQQITLAHATAFLATSVSPPLSDQVKQITNELEEALIRSDDAVTQMLVTELAMLRIWILVIEAEMLS